MKKIIYTTLVATLMLASCTQSDELNNPNNTLPQDGVIRVTTQVAGTRASMTSDDLDRFYMKVTHPTDANYSYYAMMGRNNPSDIWESYEPTITGSLDRPLQMLWKNHKDVIKVSVIAQPGFISEDAFNESSVYSVRVNQFDSKNEYLGSDVLYMYPTEIDPTQSTNLVDGKIKVTLRHLFSKLNLKMTLGNEFNLNDGTVNNPITNFAVNGTKISVAFNAATGSWGNLQWDVTPIYPWHDAAMYTPGQGINTKAVAHYECILVPQTVAAEALSVSFTINGKAYEWISPRSITLESGKEYNLTLTVGKDVVSAGSMSAQPWEDGKDDNLETE